MGIKETESWGSRMGLILAMAGNAVGLGNFLRFPVQAVQNGGGAFIIPYLVCFLVMGIPLLWVEWAMGRFGGRQGHHSTPFILDSMGKRALWKYVGVFGIWTNIAIAAYYCYLESWTLSYMMHSVLGTFHGKTQEAIGNFFTQYVSLGPSAVGIPYEPVFFFVVCLLLNTWILSKGLMAGVEKVAKVGMPLLILFGIFLAYKGLTITAGEAGALHDSSVGLNFLWTPRYERILSPTVWLAAAGQIFFTLAVGMGTIHCYASYMKSKEDIALNAMSAGWMNEFVEVVLGGAILIPVAVGYLGIDKVNELVQLGGLGLGFKTLPYLFSQWGPILGAFSSFLWFGLLFFAGITSSLAMGTPWMGFLQDEFSWRRKPAAWSFGVLVFILGMPTVLFFNYGVFDEYDYWTGTVALVVFALLECLLFAWVFGMGKGWSEITDGADIKVPRVYRFIIRYVTPALLLWVFVGSLFTPKGGDWGAYLKGNWETDNSSILNKILNSSIHEKIAATADLSKIAQLRDQLFYVNASRFLLLSLFVFICGLVFVAHQRRCTLAKRKRMEATLELTKV
ncbi:sodium-dependent transporter [Sabulibacter ruber]|uniref:sodium-dependent transporter n=1 Tax=Sabulibacter ruber TaxID=2811901 RepID=UPI001A96E342|nr:sodium-dependent transporter [Sabulibacter ruber]